ncbi:MAG: phenylalanine--tRNA ligase subunit beta [Candidatus Bathyarchaeota archaeon]|nr:phenylalanine--tRNA ligase subunit beta [Candidatus Bathyarchaeota archaeon]
MPTIEIDFEDLECLLGVDLPRDSEKLNGILSYVKGEVKLLEHNELHIELQDTNRPDLWCTEGVARALKGFLNIEKGLKNYKVAGSSGVEVHVDPKLKEIRPYIACSVVKGVQVSDTLIREIMRLQDKLDETYGRHRKRTSIGLYEFDLITPPLRYSVAEPREVRFTPLEFEEELTLEEILDKHPKGIEYGHIVRPYSVWPILMDSKHDVLSFPPIINSNDLGRLTENTKNVLIEVTGTAHDTVLNALTIITLSLADRGGSMYSAKIHYPYGGIKETRTPRLKTETLKITTKEIKTVLGMDLKPQEIRDLLERARFGVPNIHETEVTVEVPRYRVDVMHPVDVIEDIAIAYDLNRVPPRWPQLSTIGGTSPEGRLRNLIREVMVGLGFQEVLTFTMSNSDTLFAKMNIENEGVVEVANPKILSMTCLRNWLLPSLMELLSKNTHVGYPQRIFEVGYCVTSDEDQENKTEDVEKLASITIHSNASFTEMKSLLDAVLLNLGIQYELEEIEHKSFVDGRVGEIAINNRKAGIIGEVHPKVLENWKLENPAAAFEISVDRLREATHPQIS